MSDSFTRRRFLQGASALGAGSLLGLPQTASAEPPPETDTIRLTFDPQIPVLCWASQYVAEHFLYMEGFTRVEFVPFNSNVTLHGLHVGNVDITAEAIAGWVGQIDRGSSIVVLSGMHAGCFEVVAKDPIRSISQLKGKRVVATLEGNGDQLLMASVAAYIGIDPRSEIDWVYASPHDWVGMLTDGKVDAIGAFPALSYAVRSMGIGNVILHTTVDKPWRDYFCCMIGGNREFVNRNPIATKRALRAILKANDLCGSEPEATARWLTEKGFTSQFDYALQTLREVHFGAWRLYSPDDALRFFALRLHEVGMIKSTPQQIIERGTDWRFLNELKQELKA